MPKYTRTSLQNYDIGSASKLEQLDLLNRIGVQVFLLYGKAEEPDMQVLKDLFTNYLSGSELLWLKDSVNPSYAVTIGTAKYAHEEPDTVGRLG